MFVMYVAIQEQKKMLVHSKRQAQIEAQVGDLLLNEALIEVLAEYSNYSNVFSMEYVVEFSENIRINKHVIELKEGKQLLFGPIYSLG